MTVSKEVLKLLLMVLLPIILLFPQKFASIGDYGKDGSNELAVANLVKSWNPDFIITLGDNNYNDGLWSTIDENIGQYYHEYIYPYIGSYGQGSDINRFFPSPGNHDHNNLPDITYLQPYLDYFDLMPFAATSGNERYYDFVWDNLHFFSVNSCIIEPDGYVHPSVQSEWLKTQLMNCDSTHFHWKVVYFHHAPYSSGPHGSESRMQWPFKDWGADVVMSGHDHTYERVLIDSFPYFVNGLGGKSRYNFDPPIPGSEVRYNTKYGAMLMEATMQNFTFSFYSVDNELIDYYELIRLTPAPPGNLTAQIFNEPLSVNLTWTDNSGNEDGFVIERDMIASDNFEIIDSVGADITSYLDTTVNYATYIYRVKAFNSFGDSPYSDTAEVIVPVELISFTAHIQYGSIILEWITASELNNMGFEIQRNTDDKWTSIGFVDGRGSSTDKNYYSFTDHQPEVGKLNLFRLKQIDLDGSYSYSNIIEAAFELPAEFSLEQNYPNPFNPGTTIRFTISEVRFTILKVYDVLGNEIATLVNEEKPAGAYKVEFNSADLTLPSGIYFYRLTAGNFRSTKKMLLLK